MWIAESSLVPDGKLRFSIDNTYFVKILDRSSYKTYAELQLDKDTFKIFRKIMNFDKYSLQYIEHEILGEAAKIKLKQSPHRRIKPFDELDHNEQFYYLGP